MNALPLHLESSPQLLDAASLGRATVRLAHEIAEAHHDAEALVLAGIPTRGVPLAMRLARTLEGLGRQSPQVAALDPHNYRDDRARVSGAPPSLTGIGVAEPPSISDATVIVVDDVLFTGRTLRAALDALMDNGRPGAVEVLTLIDRGHRELPIRATYVGKNVPTATGDRVCVRLREIDGVDGAWLLREGES
jgi:pyrimidine operon attenuation protein / uracil phosphoribosyltransferase